MSRAGGNIYNFDAAARSAQFSHHHGIPVSIYGAHPNQLGPAAAAAVAAANTTSASQLYARDPQHYQQQQQQQQVERQDGGFGAGADRFAAARHAAADEHHATQGQPSMMRRRPSLLPHGLPQTDYGYTASVLNSQYARLERERYLEAYPYAPNYDKSKNLIGLNAPHRSQVGLGSMMPTGAGGVPLGQHGSVLTHGHTSLAGLGPPHHSIAQSHMPTHHEQEIINKRPRLYLNESKVSIHQPLRIETQEAEVKKEPAYTPQVEAISPTLPNEETRQDSSLKSNKDYLLQNLTRIDREIQQTETQLAKYRRKQQDLEKASKTVPDGQEVADVSESKQLSVAQIVYSDNRKKAQSAHEYLRTLSGGTNMVDTLPLYNQPSDNQVYYENIRKYATFKVRLVAILKKRREEKQTRETHLSESYDALMKNWLKKLEKRDANPAKKAKETKLREFFEKQFTELRKQREDKERLSRAGQRIRSDADLEEIMDGLQEQELEDKKMRSYAVIPPILTDARCRKYKFLNTNGLMEDPMSEYKERQELASWTDQEKDIFREKFLMHPKNFGLISAHLDRKTVQDCVQYYYLSKKSENYKQLLRKHVKRRTRALAKAAQAAQQQQQQQQQQLAASRQTSDQNAKAVGAQSKDADADRASTTPVAMNSQSEMSGESAVGAMKGDATEAAGVIGVHQCCLCKASIEDHTKSSAVTKADSDFYRIPLVDITFRTRICHSCKFNHCNSSNTNQVICPVPSCKTPRMKVKRLRTLPQQWHELNPDLRRAYAEELNFPLDVQRCCFRCVMRVSRRIGAVSPAFLKSKHLRKLNSDAVWKDDEIECFKRALKENGKNWELAASAVSTKSIKECRTFYYNYKYKYKLDQLLRLFNDRCAQPRVMSDTDSDEYWNDIPEGDSEETSSADEETNGKSCSDAASASPLVKLENTDDKIAHSNSHSVSTSTGGVFHDLHASKLQDSKALSGSQASLKSDYDSSATMSADEGHGEERGRSASPSLHRSGSITGAVNPSHLFPQNDRHHRPASHDTFDQAAKHNIRDQAVSSTRPPVNVEGLMSQQRQRVPSFLINPNAPSTPNSGIRPDSEQSKEEPTCVRDLIYQAIEMSLQTPAKTKGDLPAGAGSLPSPHYQAQDRARDMPRIPLYPPVDQIKHEPGSRPQAAGHEVHPVHPRAYPSPGNMRPEGLAMMSFSHHMGGTAAPPANEDEEVQDLSKKSSAHEPRTITPQQRREPTPNSREYMSAMPPPAHSKHKAHSVIEAPAPEPLGQRERDMYRQAEISRLQKAGYVGPERGISSISSIQRQQQQQQQQQMQQQAQQRVQMPPGNNKPGVPPPPPLITSAGVGGSITQGTPVMMTPGGAPIGSPYGAHGPSRYEGLLRQLPAGGKETGSITLGTPVQQQDLRKKQQELGRPDVKPHQLYEQAMSEQFFKQQQQQHSRMSPNAMPPGSYPYTPGHMALGRPSNSPHHAPAGSPYHAQHPNAPHPNYNEQQQRQILVQKAGPAAFASEAQHQIMIDFRTSKELMQTRRGSMSGERDRPPSPVSAPPPSSRPRESSSPQVMAHHRMQLMGPPYNAGAAGMVAQYAKGPGGEIRFVNPVLDRSQAERQQISPSGWNNKQNLPSPNSPQYAMINRQNVIQQWGKQSVIQAPKSVSPRDRPEDQLPPHKIYTPSFPPSHDAFQTLVNAAAAQKSLAVPGKEADRRMNLQMGPADMAKSPKDAMGNMRQTEGLERTLMDMHRPRQFVESGGLPPRMDMRDMREAHLRDQRNVYRPAPDDKRNWSETERELNERMHRTMDERERAQRVRQIFSTEASAAAQASADKKRQEYVEALERERLMVAANHGQLPPNMQNPSGLRLANNREFTKEQFERELRHPRGDDPSQIKKTLEDAKDTQYKEHFRMRQQLADNEASRIFSQAFQKDNAPKTTVAGPRGFTAATLIDAIITHQINQTDPRPSDAPAPARPPSQPAQHKVTTSEAPFDYRDKMVAAPAAAPQRQEIIVVSDASDVPRSFQSPQHHDIPPRNSMPTGHAQNLTLGEHIATIISRNYSDDAKGETSAQKSDRHPLSIEADMKRSASQSPNKPLEGIAAAASGPTDFARDSNSWKLRRALQQDDAGAESPAQREDTNKPNSRPASRERSQTPSNRQTPSQAAGVESVSPPRPRSNEGDAKPTSSLPTSLAQSRSIQNHQTSNPTSTPQQPPMSLDVYFKNRIVEVMRTSDDQQNSGESSKRSSVDSGERQRAPDSAHGSRPSSRDSANSRGPSLVPSPAPVIAQAQEGLAFRSGRSSASEELASAMDVDAQNRKGSSRSESPHIPRKRMRVNSGEAISTSEPKTARGDAPALVSREITADSVKNLASAVDAPNGAISSSGQNGVKEAEPAATDAARTADNRFARSPPSPASSEGEMVIDESAAPTSTSPGITSNCQRPLSSDDRNRNVNQSHSVSSSSMSSVMPKILTARETPSAENRCSPGDQRERTSVSSSTLPGQVFGQVFGKLSSTYPCAPLVGAKEASEASAPSSSPGLKSGPTSSSTAPAGNSAEPSKASSSGSALYEPLSDDD